MPLISKQKHVFIKAAVLLSVGWVIVNSVIKHHWIVEDYGRTIEYERIASKRWVEWGRVCWRKRSLIDSRIHLKVSELFLSRFWLNKENWIRIEKKALIIINYRYTTLQWDTWVYCINLKRECDILREKLSSFKRWVSESRVLIELTLRNFRVQWHEDNNHAELWVIW
jgi:hypothetical protein